jgi:hypothetical protein
VLLTPAAPGDGVRHVLVLEPMAAQRPQMPASAASAASVAASGRSRP